MKKYVIAAFVSGFLLSCKEETELPSFNDLDTELHFKYQLVNDEDNALQEVYTCHVVNRHSNWYAYHDDSVTLMKQITFEVAPKNGEAFTVHIQFRKNEYNTSLVVLEDKDSLYQRRWDYKSEKKSMDFYIDPDYSTFEIDYGYYFTNQSPSDYIQLTKAQNVVVDGVEKTYVEIQFQGEAFGYYDPYKEYQGYIIREGIFRGIIE